MFRDKSLIFGIAVAILPATGLLLATDSVLAQQTDEKVVGAAVEEVVVEAPVVQRKITARGSSGYTTEVVQLRKKVSYADLDLARESDAQELHKRIEMTAKEACEALKATFRRGEKDAGDVYRCTMLAIKNTEKEFESVIAAAN